ncbi:hypothetical protein [Mycolicibacterium sp. F2034L]|uniref:hypothetical protein n=1 Tax=Mycolicibacterium sp. F2034L TaxID=2926422 RepID=UPI001FF6D2CF|nr:hypothetical protein [Mycolicibacterium sp. F2034L]MCK0172995.1 hypothetical protein [Mycolicibacterium sp. F2034L]
MTSSVLVERALAAFLVVCALGLGCAATTLADPTQPKPPAPTPTAVSVPVSGVAGAPDTAACRKFAAVVRTSSAYYNEFAYSIAGNGAYVDYQDPTVIGDNADGRTALRRAAGEAIGAASTPGLSPEIANPMRFWSWHAAKLVLIMGLRGNGDTLNTAATELNAAADDAKMACANAGAQPVTGRR